MQRWIEIKRKKLLISLILAAVIAAFFIALNNPEFSLIFLIAGVAIVGEFNEWLKVNVGSGWKRVLVIGLVLAIAIGNLSEYWVNKTNTEFQEGTCILDTQTSEASGTFWWGGTQEGFTNGQSVGSSANNQLGSDPLVVSLESGHINIEDTIRNYSGQILAYVSGDAFHVQQPGLEYNCSKSAVEVKDSQGNVVQQVIISNGNVAIYGVNFYSLNTFVCTTYDGFHGPFDPNHLDGADACLSLKPIFKYPAAEYQGVFVGTSTISIPLQG